MLFRTYVNFLIAILSVTMISASALVMADAGTGPGPVCPRNTE